MDGLSQGVIPGKCYQKPDVLHVDENVLQFQIDNGLESFTLIDHNILSYIPFTAFSLHNISQTMLPSFTTTVSKKRP